MCARTSPAEDAARRGASVAWDLLAYAAEPRHLRRIVPTAILAGVILTPINQGSVITADQATAATRGHCALTFIVPFPVSNAG